MDNQHRKIKGYRELSEHEIALMNQIKEHGEQTKLLIDEVRMLRLTGMGITLEQFEQAYSALRKAEDDLKTGQMWLVRAVALPETF